MNAYLNSDCDCAPQRSSCCCFGIGGTICFFAFLIAFALGLILGAVFYETILPVLAAVIAFAAALLAALIALVIFRCRRTC